MLIQKLKKILQLGVQYGAWTLFAHLMLVLRDVALAGTLGVSLELDAWLTVLAMPYFLSSAIVGAFAGVLVPWMTRQIEESKRVSLATELARLIRRYWFYLLCLLLLVTVANAFFVSNFSALGPQRLTQMIVSAGVYFFIMCLQGGFRSYLLAYKKTAFVVGSPIVGAAFCILFLLWRGPEWGISSFILGLILGGLLELFILIYLSRSEERRHQALPQSTFNFEKVKQGYYHLLFSGLLMGATLIIDQLMTAQMFGKGVSSLNYGGKVTAGLIGILGGVISVMMFPEMASSFAKTNRLAFYLRVRSQAGITFFLSLLPTLIIYFYSKEIVSLLFLRGEFNLNDLDLVAEIQKYYILQIPFYFAGGVLVKAFQVVGENKRIMQIAFFNVILNMLWNYLFGLKYGIPGIALSTSLVYAGSFTMLILSRGVLTRPTTGEC